MMKCQEKDIMGNIDKKEGGQDEIRTEQRGKNNKTERKSMERQHQL